MVMATNDMIRLIKSLPPEQRLEFVVQLTELKNKARGCVLKPLPWPGGYLADFERDGRSYCRNILVVGTDSNASKLIAEAMTMSSSKADEDKAFQKLECYVFGVVDEQDSLVEQAEFKYDMTLVIHEAESLVKMVEEFPDLRVFIKINRDNPTSFKLNRNKKILCDLFTTGAAVAGIKSSFVSSFIQMALYSKGDMHPVDLKEEVKKSLVNLSDNVYDSALSVEFQYDHIVNHDELLALTDNFREKLDRVVEETQATESVLFRQFETCLATYGLQGISSKVMDKVTAIYKSHYEGEEDLFSSQENKDKRDRKLYRELQTLIQKNGKNLKDSRKITNEILQVVGENEYLNKTSLTTMFTAMFNSNQLDEYMSRQRRIVWIDTQILLGILCVLKDEIDYRDTLYDSSLMLLKQLKESRDYVELYTSTEYIDEVTSHLWDAHSLNRFLSLPYIQDLGPSKNVFYNFYRFLVEEMGDDYESFDEFLVDMFAIEDPLPSDRTSFKSLLFEIVTDMLETMANIEVKTLDFPENLDDYIEVYNKVMYRSNVFYRNNHAKENDMACAHWLSDENNFINQETKMPEVPFFITLDKTMFPFRDEMVSHFHRKRYYVYPPVKFANRLSVMNLRLDSAKVNYNVICLTENNFNASGENMYMMDIISKLMPSASLDDKETLKALGALKRSQMDDVTLKDFAAAHNNNLPIDLVLTDITRYFKNISWEKYRRLGILFEDNSKTEALIKLLKSSCQYYLNHQKTNDTVYKKIDELMMV